MIYTLIFIWRRPLPRGNWILKQPQNEQWARNFNFIFPRSKSERWREVGKHLGFCRLSYIQIYASNTVFLSILNVTRI